MSGPDVVTCLVATPIPEARGLARELVERRLAACVNIVDGVRSVYRWQGEVAEAHEAILVIKTTRGQVEAIDAALAELHPYEVYELVGIDVTAGNAAYLAWVDDESGPATEAAPPLP